MLEVNGGGWIGDALRWTGDKLKKAWNWLKKMNRRTGENGGNIPLN